MFLDMYMKFLFKVSKTLYTKVLENHSAYVQVTFMHANYEATVPPHVCICKQVIILVAINNYHLVTVCVL